MFSTQKNTLKPATNQPNTHTTIWVTVVGVNEERLEDVGMSGAISSFGFSRPQDGIRSAKLGINDRNDATIK